MDLYTWKAHAEEALTHIASVDSSDHVDTLVSRLAATTLWPLIAAAKTRNMEAMQTFMQMASELNAATLMVCFGGWVNAVVNQEEAAKVIDADLRANQGLHKELNALFEKLGILEAFLRQSEDKKEALAKHLYEAWDAAGDTATIERLSQRVGLNLGKIVGKEINIKVDKEVLESQVEEARRRYLEHLRTSARRLPLKEVGALKEDEAQVTLKDVYVGLKVQEATHGKDREEGARQALHDVGEEAKLPEAMDRIASHPRVVLLGDPGFGEKYVCEPGACPLCRCITGPQAHAAGANGTRDDARAHNSARFSGDVTQAVSRGSAGCGAHGRAG